MSTILDIGASAMMGASHMALDAAGRVTKATLPPAQPSQSPNASYAHGSPVLVPGRVHTDPLLEGLVDLRKAELAYKAGAQIIRTETEMQDKLMRAV